MKKDQFFNNLQSKYKIVSVNIYVHLENLFRYYPDYHPQFKEAGLLDKTGLLLSRGEMDIEDVLMFFRALNFQEENRYDQMFDIGYIMNAPKNYKSQAEWQSYFRNNYVGSMKKIK
ncbi:hypothetical protein SSABA_v1c05540 [Spiroplasma sabaudiense Ar-1343]|uniref:Uncharacterized protein n=1 Tax=Spiroplasma sabaudiense Ar-1343 TaxID=1276257 RepID=W6A9V3_9MOLU|nr:hypothetical protein [Spiroplasma sabaudiense]AHI53958.1 hypothetical protein SSABA_v1c05540 [Spiroplasma sabaudiense Ar-1343]